MSTPAFYWSPNQDAVITKTDLGRALSDFDPQHRRVGTASADGAGQPHTFDYGGGFDVLIESLSMSSASTFRALQTMETALRRRQTVTFAMDPAKLWVGVILTGSTGLDAGDTVLETTGNIFDYETATLAAGDILVIESGNPEGLVEYVTVDSVAPHGGGGVDITLTAPVVYTRTVELGVIVRHYRCFPALYLPDDAADSSIIYTSNNGRLYNLEMTLRSNGRIHGLVAGGTVTEGEYTLSAGLPL